MTIIAPDKRRAQLARIQERFKGAVGIDKIQFSFLRVHVLCSAAASTYDFNIKKDAGTTAAHERKLDTGDAFVITDFQIGLLKEDPAKPGTGQIYSYPNSSGLAVAAEVDITHCEIFFNGWLNVKVGDRVYQEAISTRGNRCVRTSQKSSATTFDEKGSDDGFQDLNPDVTLYGAQKNELKLIVPNFTGLLVQETTAATRLYVAFIARGFQIIGGGKLGDA